MKKQLRAVFSILLVAMMCLPFYTVRAQSLEENQEVQEEAPAEEAQVSQASRATQVSQVEQDEAFKKERRIFLWDVTISMVGATQQVNYPKARKRSNPDYAYDEGFPNYIAHKDIFDSTRETLIKKIMQVQNESTEIIVLPFRDGIVGEMKANATAQGKQALKDQIMKWNDLHKGGTYTGTSLQEAVQRYFTPDRTNRIVLLTDGEPTIVKNPDGTIKHDERKKLMDFIKNWDGHKETKGTGAYLVYVMLTDEADNEEIEDLAKKNPEKIQVVTSDQPFDQFVQISIKHNTSVHVREFMNSEEVDTRKQGLITIPCTLIEGEKIPDDKVFHFAIEDNDYIAIDEARPIKTKDGKFTIPFTLKESSREKYSEMAASQNNVFTMTCVKDPATENIALSGSNAVAVELVYKPEPRVSISWSTK